MQCRFAGPSTPIDSFPVTSSMALVNNGSYVVSCTKSPDQANNTTIVTLTVTHLDAVNGNQTAVDTYTVPAVGAMQSKEAISAGNKYPLPAANKNTDQFFGDVTRAVYCASTTNTDVDACLATYLPVQTGAFIVKQH
jgi:hypothetical protein